MRVIKTDFPDLYVIEPKVFSDERGFFFENWSRRTLESLGIVAEFVQDNHSRPVRNVLRGLHYQIQRPQGKMVRVINSDVFDVAVDLRKSSPTFGKWIGFTLSAVNLRMVWIPPGFAHGFLTLSESVEFLYKTTDYWYPEHERTLLWNDPTLDIAWPLISEPILAPKDHAGIALRDAETYA